MCICKTGLQHKSICSGVHEKVQKRPDAAFASIIHQSSFFPPEVAPADMLPVLDDDFSAMYIHSDVNKAHEFLFDRSHYRHMDIYQF